VAAVRYGVAKQQLHVYVTVTDAQGRRVRDAAVTVALYRNGKVYARAGGTTGTGSMTFTRPASAGSYRVKVTRVVALNSAWDGVTPSNTFTMSARPKTRRPTP
jgi:PHP family Zn ribbon phosphoesterase